MGRIRTIKPEFPDSESIGRLSRDARLLFIELFTIADDEGRCRGNSKWLARALFPFDEDAPELIDGWLEELEAEGMVRRYRVDRDSYLDIPKWKSHQKIDRPTPSKFPSWDGRDRDIVEPSRALDEDSTSPRGVLAAVSGPGPVPGPGEDQGPISPAEPVVKVIYGENFESWWKVYPRRESKGYAQKKFLSALKDLVPQHGSREKAFEWLMMRTRAYADSPKGKGDKQYIPHPATWLEGKKFHDDDDAWQDTSRPQAKAGSFDFDAALKGSAQ